MRAALGEERAPVPRKQFQGDTQERSGVGLKAAAPQPRGCLTPGRGKKWVTVHFHNRRLRNHLRMEFRRISNDPGKCLECMIEFSKDASRMSNLFLKLNFTDNSRDHPRVLPVLTVGVGGAVEI